MVARTVTLTINGHRVQVMDGATLLDAARAAGVHVPTLCFHPRLPAHAACRMCLVEVAGSDHAQPACATPAREGDAIRTDTPALRAFREADGEWLLARHPNECLQCEASGDCRLQSLVHEQGWRERWPQVPRGSPAHAGHRLADHASPAIWRDLRKCIECGLCVDACGEPGQQQFVIGFAGRGDGRLPVTVFDRELRDTACISCGQCTLACPTGALIEAPQWHEVLRVLDARERVGVVQVAPATRVAISEEFGLPAGTVGTGRLINALRRLGFDHVFDTNFGADLTIMEEATELLQRVATRAELPLFTSCCPGWVNWVELNRPDLLPHLSTTRSPQQMHGSLTRAVAFASSPGAPLVVSVMPCTAKKDEALRPGLAGDVDHVLTTRELARMIRARAIAFGELPDDGRFDDPLGASTGAAQLFGASGGVMEAMVRTAAHLAGVAGGLPLEWQALRGEQAGVRECDVPGLGRVAACNGIASAQRLLADDAWRTRYLAIEVMACVGGCLGGGGEPRSLDPQVLRKRTEAIHAIDQRSLRRRSHENPDVQRLYATVLGAPGSPEAHRLLHTAFAPRRSPRALLMQFLDAVDRRDAEGAARLFHPVGTWSTASALGEVRGRAAIAALVRDRLPPRNATGALPRHRMASAAGAGDFAVVTPGGERCTFDIDCAAVAGSDPAQPLIMRLARRLLPPASRP